MSYILDALKKAEQKRQLSAKVPTLATVHRKPAPARSATPFKIWPWIAGAVIVANAGIAGWLLLPTGTSSTTSLDGSARSPSVPTATAPKATGAAPPAADRGTPGPEQAVVAPTPAPAPAPPWRRLASRQPPSRARDRAPPRLGPARHRMRPRAAQPWSKIPLRRRWRRNLQHRLRRDQARTGRINRPQLRRRLRRLPLLPLLRLSRALRLGPFQLRFQPLRLRRR